MNIFQQYLKYHFLTRQLVKVSLTVEFKKSFLGLLWFFITPMLAIVVWLMLNGAGVLNPGEVGMPYVVFVLLSMSVWGFFADIYTKSSNIINNNARILLSSSPSSLVFLVERIVVHIIHFIVPLAINIIVLSLFGIRISGWQLVVFLFSLLPLLWLGLGIGLIISLFRVVADDIARVSDQFIRLLMFFTPVVYAPKIQLGWLSHLIFYNPLTYLISFPRDVLTKGEWYEPYCYLYSSIGCLLFFMGALWLYLQSERKVLERLINN